MRNIHFIGNLIFWGSAIYSMEIGGREEFIIKVVNKTPHLYYLKIPEEFVDYKDYRLSDDEYQRWGVNPHKEEDVVFSVPRDATFALAIQIKSLSPKDKKHKNDTERPCVGNMLAYKNSMNGHYLLHFCQRFHSSIRIESEKFAHAIKLLITEKPSGRSLVQLCK